MSLACAIANNVSSPRVNNHIISLQSTESYITSILPVLLLIIFYPLLVPVSYTHLTLPTNREV